MYDAGVQTGWSYDAFGNRLSETQGKVSGANPTASMPTSSTNTYTAASNQLSTSTLTSSITCDAAGDITYDGSNHYLYDAEGRICAVQNASNAITGYVYDAAGIRAAKGSLTSFSCNFASNGYATTTSWVLGPGGEQVTEYDVSGTTQTWQHTNAFASGALLATYHDTDTYLALEDWLGTKRGEISAGRQIANYRSLTYGNGLTTLGSATDATEHHFTGKERDAESGNDYFFARYYSSNLGRFMSPDWSAKEDPVPYAHLDDPQSLNLYAYVRNNPATGIDPDGHEEKCDFGCQLNKAWHTVHEIVSPAPPPAPPPPPPPTTAQQQSPQVQSLVNAQDAAMANGKYQPDTPTAGTTHCSEAACAIAKATGTNLTGILYDSKGNNYDANTQINNLANSPNFHVVTPDQAQALGDKGVLVFGTQHGARHGHIASVRPEGIPGDQPRGRSGPILANVGLFNGVAHQSAVMTPAHGAIVYYAPNQ